MMSDLCLENAQNGVRNIKPLTVKSNSWPSRGETVYNRQEKGQKARKWRLLNNHCSG